MARFTPLIPLGLLLFSLTPVVSQEPRRVTAMAQWSGSVSEARLETIAPRALTNQESFEILWKAWAGPEEVPILDFADSIVVVSTTRGSRLQLTVSIDQDGDLKVLGMATRDLRPGFRYVLAQVDSQAVRSIAGEPLVLGTTAGESDFQSFHDLYRPSEKVSERLKLGGSKSMAQILAVWAEGFKGFHPELEYEIACEGSNTALQGLQEDGMALMAMSRQLKGGELLDWESSLGKTIHRFPVCRDEIRVIVHRENPITELSEEGLRAVFSGEQGDKEAVWGDLGLEEEWETLPVALHGRDANSGTRQFLLDRLGLTGDASTKGVVHDSFSGILHAVAEDRAAIGYSRAMNLRDNVKSVSIVRADDGQSSPEIERVLYLVLAVPEDQPLPNAAKEFLEYIYCFEGQSQLFRDGLTMLPKQELNQQLQRLGVDDES